MIEIQEARLVNELLCNGIFDVDYRFPYQHDMEMIEQFYAQMMGWC
jgi:hypothetical protein